MRPAKFGFGTYRVNTKNEEHYKSLYRAITGGISLIDTSSNYNGGWSEVLIGNVLSDLINENKIKRDNITLITKGGYIQIYPPLLVDVPSSTRGYARQPHGSHAYYLASGSSFQPAIAENGRQAVAKSPQFWGYLASKKR